MTKTTIHTNDAPAAIGPYAQAIRSGSFLFTSGQLGIDVATGEIPASVELQARHALANLAAILQEAGITASDVIKTTVFLTDMADFALVNEVYASFFGEAKPARSCVAVAALPKGANVEIECIAQLA